MLVRDPALDATDRYGRQLRYVFAAGTNVNLALVRAGAASPYFFRRERGRYAARSPATAVAEARTRSAATGAPARGAQLDTRPRLRHRPRLTDGKRLWLRAARFVALGLSGAAIGFAV